MFGVVKATNGRTGLLCNLNPSNVKYTGIIVNSSCGCGAFEVFPVPANEDDLSASEKTLITILPAAIKAL